MFHARTAHEEVHRGSCEKVQADERCECFSLIRLECSYKLSHLQVWPPISRNAKIETTDQTDPKRRGDMQSHLPHDVNPTPILRRLEARQMSDTFHTVVLRRLPPETRGMRPDIPLRVPRKLDGTPLPQPDRVRRCRLGSAGDTRRFGIRGTVHADGQRAVRFAGQPSGDRTRGARGDEDSEEDGGGVSQGCDRG